MSPKVLLERSRKPHNPVISNGNAWAISILGVTLLLGAISGGQKALLQGVRRIGDLARVSVVAMFLNTGVTLGIYVWLGQEGIVPA